MTEKIVIGHVAWSPDFGKFIVDGPAGTNINDLGPQGIGVDPDHPLRRRVQLGDSWPYDKPFGPQPWNPKPFEDEAQKIIDSVMTGKKSKVRTKIVKEGFYVIQAQLPGFKKEDISITLEALRLSIHAKHASGESFFENLDYNCALKPGDRIERVELIDGILQILIESGADTKAQKFDVGYEAKPDEKG